MPATRRGVGRPPGTPNRLTRELADRIQATGQDDVSVALSMVAEDGAAPLDARLEAMRRLFGLLAGKLYASTLATSHENIRGEQ